MKTLMTIKQGQIQEQKNIVSELDRTRSLYDQCGTASAERSPRCSRLDGFRRSFLPSFILLPFPSIVDRSEN